MILHPRFSSLTDEAVERLARHSGRDTEFLRRFGRWRRPEFARRYPLEVLLRDVRFHPGGVIDVAPFLRRLAPEDRRVAGEVARFVSEPYEGRPATDRTLWLFTLDLARRLEECGF